MIDIPARMRLEDESTWPSDVLAFLNEFAWVYKAWEPDKKRKGVIAAQYDHTVGAFREVLKRHCLLGYHCTRLTSAEQELIRSQGMEPLSDNLLTRRVAQLRTDGLISDEFAQLILTSNYANQPNRRGMIWFVFFPPRLVAECGIDHFFRFWGGESAYWPHYDQIEGVDDRFARVGCPCLIEADVPIAILQEHTFLDTIIARRYLKRRGMRTRESINPESYARHAIGPENIRRILMHPSREFVRLTRCDRWTVPLR